MSELRSSRAERTPLFEAVGAALKREIASGRFAETNVLPGERELSEMLDVSRTTLRRAIAALVDDGVLAHRHGAGTFVRRNPPHVEQPLSRLTSFTEDMRLRGLTASSRVIERGTYLPTPEEAMMLGIGPGESVYRLSRLRLADGVPMAIDHAAVPLRFLNGAHAGGRVRSMPRLKARVSARCARCSACAQSSSARLKRPCWKSLPAPRARYSAHRLSGRRAMRRVHPFILSVRHFSISSPN